MNITVKKIKNHICLFHESIKTFKYLLAVKKKSMIIVVFFLLFLISCVKKTYDERLNDIKLIDGEYYSALNSENGLSIRGDKLAFFEKMTFDSSDIYEYVIIDSIWVENNSENKIGTYFKMFYLKDTIYVKIEKLLDSTIILNKNNKLESLSLRTKVVFKEK